MAATADFPFKFPWLIHKVCVIPSLYHHAQKIMSDQNEDPSREISYKGGAAKVWLQRLGLT